jgi:hypothetical protein
MSYKSNFLSDFSGNLGTLDILSSVSNSVVIHGSGSSSSYGRYVVLGNLLIQFSDFSTGSVVAFASGSDTTFNFPHPYDSVPYSVVAQGYKTNNTAVDITIFNITSTSFTFHVSTSDGGITFIAIGPRPSSL